MSSYIVAVLRLITVLILLCSISQLAAQRHTRAVKGTVTDQNGKALQGAPVQIENTRTLDVRSFVAQDEGAYYFCGLDPDTVYRLEAKYKGISGSEETLSAFNSNEVAIINLRIGLNQ